MGSLRCSQRRDSSPMLDSSGPERPEGPDGRPVGTADLKVNPGTMSTESLPVFAPRNLREAGPGGDLTCSDKGPLLTRNPDMPPRYESEEEEVSEADTPSREEHYFSTTDVESDTGGSEQDHNIRDVDYGYTNDNDALTLRMSASLRPKDDYSRPTSVYTIKPTTDNGVLTPMPLLHSSQDSPPTSIDSSDPPSPVSPLLPTFYTPSTPSTQCDPDVPSHLRSFYSDNMSSDEDPTMEAHFLTATPVTYFAPNTKPNLVFIPPSFVQSSEKKVFKKPKRQRPSSISRQSSTGSNRSTTTMRARLERMRSVKQNERRNSRLITEELPDPFAPGPHTSSSSSSSVFGPGGQTRERNDSGSSSYSTSNSDENENSELWERQQWQLNENAAKNRMSYHIPRNVNHQPPPSTRGHQPAKSETAVNKLSIETKPGRKGGYRIPAASTFPLPNTIGMATSAPKPSFTSGPSTDASPSQRRPWDNTHRYSSLSRSPDSFVSSQGHNHNRQRDGWCPHHPPFNYDDLSSRSSSSHDTRSQSISSASSSSKLSSPPFDNGSVKSMVHRYGRRHHNDSVSSAGSGPGRSSPFSDRGLRGAMGHNHNASATQLGLYPPNSADGMSPTGRKSASRALKESGTSPTPHSLRSGSTRWLSDTRETVSHVGSKAFTGIGSMLRKKTASPE